jgi:hypothetical protein
MQPKMTLTHKIRLQSYNMPHWSKVLLQYSYQQEELWYCLGSVQLHLRKKLAGPVSFRQTTTRRYVESQSMPEVKSEYIAKCDEGSITARTGTSTCCT